MFYGRQLAAAALRSHRPQTTLRAAAQVSSPCSLWPRGSAGKAQGRGPAPGLSAALARPGCPALHRGCGPGLRAGARGSWARLRPPAAGGPAGRPGSRPHLREPAGAIPEGTGAVLARGQRFRTPFG
jgi:hypothetical protein